VSIQNKGIMEDKITPNDKISELNNKIDTLVTMMEKILLLLEEK
jgi:hypothetical protein